MTEEIQSRGNQPPSKLWSAPYLVGSVEGSESVGVKAVAHGEGVGNLEERRHAECLGDIGAHAAEHVVGEKDISCNLFVQVFDGARVGEAELGSPFGKGIERIAKSIGKRIRCEERLESIKGECHDCDRGPKSRPGLYVHREKRAVGGREEKASKKNTTNQGSFRG